ncbi:response regulator [Patescibacteria group bacterium]|nr:response regulator [Patescibacteria group bacterium]
MAETKGKKILIAEDDKFLAKAYEAKLEKSGFEVTIAKDGEEALRMMKETKPDLVLLDLVMPVKNGFEVLEEISKDATLKKIPIIIVSNLGQEADVMHGKELGVADYLVKAEYSLQQVTDLIASKVR